MVSLKNVSQFVPAICNSNIHSKKGSDSTDIFVLKKIALFSLCPYFHFHFCIRKHEIKNIKTNILLQVEEAGKISIGEFKI